MGFLIATSAVFFVFLVITHVWDGYWNWAVDDAARSMGKPWVYFSTFLGYAAMLFVSIVVAFILPYLWIVGLFILAGFFMNSFAKNIAARIRTLLERINQ